MDGLLQRAQVVCKSQVIGVALHVDVSLDIWQVQAIQGLELS